MRTPGVTATTIALSAWLFGRNVRAQQPGIGRNDTVMTPTAVVPDATANPTTGTTEQPSQSLQGPPQSGWILPQDVVEIGKENQFRYIGQPPQEVLDAGHDVKVILGQTSASANELVTSDNSWFVVQLFRR